MRQNFCPVSLSIFLYTILQKLILFPKPCLLKKNKRYSKKHSLKRTHLLKIKALLCFLKMKTIFLYVFVYMNTHAYMILKKSYHYHVTFQGRVTPKMGQSVSLQAHWDVLSSFYLILNRSLHISKQNSWLSSTSLMPAKILYLCWGR